MSLTNNLQLGTKFWAIRARAYFYVSTNCLYLTYMNYRILPFQLILEDGLELSWKNLLAGISNPQKNLVLKLENYLMNHKFTVLITISEKNLCRIW